MLLIYIFDGIEKWQSCERAVQFRKELWRFLARVLIDSESRAHRLHNDVHSRSLVGAVQPAVGGFMRDQDWVLPRFGFNASFYLNRAEQRLATPCDKSAVEPHPLSRRRLA